MIVSLNNKLILEPYKHEGKIKASVTSGFATISQKGKLVGLKALEYGEYCIGPKICGVPKGSVVYFKEEILHTHEWSTKVFTRDGTEERFIIAESSNVVMVDIFEEDLT